MELSLREELVLRAVVDRLLPEDADPGAWEAGAKDYLLLQLDRDLRPMRDLVLSGLASLDAEAQAWFASGFAEQSPDDRDTLLRAIERGDVRVTWTVSPTGFFDLLVRTTAEGFYGDPGQGGNRNGVSWAMTGFEREPK